MIEEFEEKSYEIKKVKMTKRNPGGCVLWWGKAEILSGGNFPW
jgi:hypothetical protein